MDSISKNQSLILYILDYRRSATITELMKIAYLSDYMSFQQFKRQITSFSYIRYYHSPFDSDLCNEVEDLLKRGYASSEVDFSPSGQEFIKYIPILEIEKINISLTENDTEVISNVLNELRGCGAKVLTEITYKTAPMKALGATMKNTEGINQQLDFNKI